MSSSFIHVVASRFHSKWPLDHSELASQACPFEDATWAGSQRATPNAEPDAVNLHLPGTNELLPGTSCEADGRVYNSRPMRSLSIACVMTSTSPTDMTCWEIASNNFWKWETIARKMWKSGILLSCPKERKKKKVHILKLFQIFNKNFKKRKSYSRISVSISLISH